MGAYDNLVKRDDIDDTKTITRDDARDENFDLVRAMARDLGAIARGEFFKCPECGAWIGEHNTAYNEIYDTGECLVCHADFNSDDAEPVSMYDYFENVLDATYYSSGRNADNYKGVRLCVAFGGPNIYIDTFRRTVELYWGLETATCDIFADVVDAIDDIFMEIWQC